MAEVASRLWGWLESAGIREVEQKTTELCLGTDSSVRELKFKGIYTHVSILTAVDKMAAYLAQSCAWSQQDLEGLAVSIGRVLINQRRLSRVRIIWGN